MSARTRIRVAALIVAGLLAGVALVLFASFACPVETEAQPCPAAARNLVIGVTLATLATALLITPFAFLAEFVARRRIVYRGAWWRAGRRGAIAALVVATFAGLRLGSTLSVPIALFVLVLAGALEWFVARWQR